MKPKYPFIWNIDEFHYSHAEILKKKPTFFFTAQIQEINCFLKDYDALRKLEERHFKNGVPPEAIEMYKGLQIEEGEDPT